MERLVFYSSRRTYLLFMLLALALVFGGIHWIATKESQVIGWIGVVFFGLGFLIFTWMFLDPRPHLIIDDDGIMDRMLGVGVIPWLEIDAAYLKSFAGIPFLCLEVRDPQKYLRRVFFLSRLLRSLNRGLGFPELIVNLDGLNTSPHRIYEIVVWKLETRRTPRETY